VVYESEWQKTKVLPLSITTTLSLSIIRLFILKVNNQFFLCVWKKLLLLHNTPKMASLEYTPPYFWLCALILISAKTIVAVAARMIMTLSGKELGTDS
jgi:hypothetical protein